MAYPWEMPFVVDVPEMTAEVHGSWDRYDPGAGGPRPAVVFVHGGPLPAGLPVSPRHWPAYRGYGTLAAGAGLVGVTVDHELHELAGLDRAHAVLARAVDAVRAHRSVDGDRIAIWAFSGGSPLLTPWLADPPPWLRCLAATYPFLDSTPDFPLPEGFRPIEVLRDAPALPFVLTRVGLEAAPVAAGVARFLSEPSRLDVRVVDVPNGGHGFDTANPGQESVAAVHSALDLVGAALRA